MYLPQNVKKKIVGGGGGAPAPFPNSHFQGSVFVPLRRLCAISVPLLPPLLRIMLRRTRAGPRRMFVFFYKRTVVVNQFIGYNFFHSFEIPGTALSQFLIISVKVLGYFSNIRLLDEEFYGVIILL